MPKRYKRNCDVCRVFYHGGGKRYCSNACKAKCPVWQENIQKNPKRFKKGHVPWSKGKHFAMNPKCVEVLRDYIKKNGPWNRGTKGVMKRNSGTLTSDRVRGANNVNWKGGITDKNTRIRHSPEYKEWRMKVFQRDRFRCVVCGYRSKKPRDIRADHIKPFSLYTELRFDVDNGRTLCLPCDLKYGWNCLRDSNDNFNYAFTRNQYETRIEFRSRVFQVLTPPHQCKVRRE